jgi:predicted transcriptional regulator
MSSDLESLYKILMDEENRKILRLLDEKGALTYDEIRDALCMGVLMLDYSLKVLNKFLAKNIDDKYILSEKGK